jgi:3-oxoacyl-[acyl-carrier protein] reductase
MPRGTEFAGKVAIVVGGSRGIGAAVSRRLASDGAAVGLIYRSRAAEAERLAAELGHLATVMPLRADVSVPRALLAAIDAVVARFGRLDILVNVAGISITGPLTDYPDDAFDRQFAVNVRAPFLASKRAAATMTFGGRIITVGSIVADRMPGAGGALYSASKSALGGLTRGLARDLGPRGITVNLVQPGPIDTEQNPADGPNAAANRSPLAIARHGTADEVAGLIAYLASADAAYVTGATYNIDGGWSA